MGKFPIIILLRVHMLSDPMDFISQINALSNKLPLSYAFKNFFLANVNFAQLYFLSFFTFR